MRAFAPELRATSLAAPAKGTIRRWNSAGRTPDVSHIHQSGAARFDQDSTDPPSSSVAYNFSRIPVHSAARTEPQLSLSTLHDRFEQEAERVSEQLMSVPAARPQHACLCGSGCPECQTEQPLREQDRQPTTHASNEPNPGSLPPVIHQVTSSSGRFLDPGIRRFMQSHLGHDFSNVRIHVDSDAATSARAINANAYTLGEHIVFAAGQYAPETAPGKRLLAHELAHVVQQRLNAPPLIARQPAQKPAPDSPAHQPDAAAQRQPASTQPTMCSRLDLSRLQLPRKNPGGAEFFEVTAKGIRFLAALDKKQAGKVRSNIDGAAEQITKLNRAAGASANQVKLVIVTDGGSEFRLLCGTPVLIIDPQEFTAETAAHEAMHGITAVLRQSSQTKGAQASEAKNFLDKVIDIYLQLSGLTIEVSPGNVVAATNLVDPQTLNPKERAEHPQANVDEFLSSAVAVFLVYRTELEKKIQQYGATEKRIQTCGDRLIKLLDDFVNKQTLPAKPLPVGSTAQDIEAEAKKIKPTQPVDDAVYVTHGLLTELLFPPGNIPQQP